MRDDDRPFAGALEYLAEARQLQLEVDAILPLRDEHHVVLEQAVRREVHPNLQDTEGGNLW